MTDRELLALAAKAAGIKCDLEGPYIECQATKPAGYRAEIVRVNWNPLADDGEALRLAVELKLELSLSYDARSRVFAERKGVVCCGENYGDQLAATRRAIVRAAAEIGRSMP